MPTDPSNPRRGGPDRQSTEESWLVSGPGPAGPDDTAAWFEPPTEAVGGPPTQAAPGPEPGEPRTTSTSRAPRPLPTQNTAAITGSGTPIGSVGATGEFPRTGSGVIPGDGAPEIDEWFGNERDAMAAGQGGPRVMRGRVSGHRLPRRTARHRPRVRRVQRIVRRVEPWSVLKVALLFWTTLYVVFLVAGVMLWSVIVSTGTLDNVENFVAKTFALDTFTFDGAKIFRAFSVLGVLGVIVGTAATVTMAVFFNLISDLTGGVRVTVLEEEVRRIQPD